MNDAQRVFCPFPWVHLATHPTGHVSVCCESVHSDGTNMAHNRIQNQLHFLTLGHDSLNAITNSDLFCETRQQMLMGEEPKACRVCYEKERQGITSKRQLEQHLVDYSLERARGETSPDGRISPDYQFIELRLGNICNLKCRTCNPASSCHWESDYQHLQNRLPFVTRYDILPSHWYEIDSFWTDLANKVSSLRLININGGEPALAKGHIDFLRRLSVLDRSSSVSLVYNSNMTILNDEMISTWKRFHTLEIRASIDDVDERNHYIRAHANWDAINRHIDTICEITPHVSIMQTVSAYNIYYLEALRTWAMNKGLSVCHNVVHDPRFLSPSALPGPLKTTIANRLRPIIPMVDRWLPPIDEGIQHELTEQFIRYTRALDEIRCESFSTVFPELFHAFEKERQSIA